MPHEPEGNKFHRYLVSLSKDGRVLESVWTETLSEARAYKLHYEGEYEVEIGDFTCFDAVNGYLGFLSAARKFASSPCAVYCLTTRRGYKSDDKAMRATGDTRYYVKLSCRTGLPTPSGKIWRKINE